MKYFSSALQYECKSFGVTIQLLSPVFVRTNLLVDYSAIVYKQPQFLMPSADVYARNAVKTLGVSDNTTGYFWHDIEVRVIETRDLDLNHLA